MDPARRAVAGCGRDHSLKTHAGAALDLSRESTHEAAVEDSLRGGVPKTVHSIDVIVFRRHGSSRGRHLSRLSERHMKSERPAQPRGGRSTRRTGVPRREEEIARGQPRRGAAVETPCRRHGQRSGPQRRCSSARFSSGHAERPPYVPMGDGQLHDGAPRAGRLDMQLLASRAQHNERGVRVLCRLRVSCDMLDLVRCAGRWGDRRHITETRWGRSRVSGLT